MCDKELLKFNYCFILFDFLFFACHNQLFSIFEKGCPFKILLFEFSEFFFVAFGFRGLRGFWLLWLLACVAFVASVAFGFRGFCGFWLLWLSWLLDSVWLLAFVDFSPTQRKEGGKEGRKAGGKQRRGLLRRVACGLSL